jgi:hypothetical protein
MISSPDLIQRVAVKTLGAGIPVVDLAFETFADDRVLGALRDRRE